MGITRNHAKQGDFCSTPWYVAYTKPNFERRAMEEMRAKGLITYLPAYEEVHEWADRRRVVEVPLFPGYVFSSFDDSPEARLAILRTTGILRLLGTHQHLEPLSDPELQAIQRLLSAKLPCYTHPFIKEGEPVRVRRGPLRGINGILLRVKSKFRLVLSVTLLSRSIATEINARDVEPIYCGTNPSDKKARTTSLAAYVSQS